MYPSFIEDAAGEERENPTSIAKEQPGETVHFLDIELVLLRKSGVSQIRMYDTRDPMATLAESRGYPHVEIRLSQSCIHTTLHCQLCRFATRYTEILYFQMAATKLTKDIMKNKYVKEKLRNTLHYFKNAFFEKSPITVFFCFLFKPPVDGYK